MLCVHVYVEARGQDQVSFQYLGESFTSPLFKKIIFNYFVYVCVCKCQYVHVGVGVLGAQRHRIHWVTDGCELPVIGAGTSARAVYTLNFSLAPTLFFETSSFTKSWGLMA